MKLIDRLICEFDRGLRTMGGAAVAQRPNPARGIAPEERNPETREEAVRLMRINHAGEVCAQALYQGQALVARSVEARTMLLHAAEEERDHLAWCDQRLRELAGSRSVLNPLWYAGSFGLGVVSGVLGDRWSMGFLVETERQVEAHLNDHLERVPEADLRTRKILETMRDDEIRHGAEGAKHGAAELPRPVRSAMRLFSRVMTRTAYWV